MKRSTSAFVTLLGLVFSTSIALCDDKPKIISVKKIWNEGTHNAFTDLIRFKGSWWCTFREAAAHGNGA
ncbi:MAG: exo-alpha-sialidase, partial [Planctomycetes bacterium]|nr:exo-alpha-sialidase [Planctomycetota bacterium]